MTDSIDTHVPGKPEDIRALSFTLAESTAAAIASAGDTLVGVRRSAESAWDSPAGSEFQSRTSEQIEPMDSFEAFLRETSSELSRVAGELQACQELMEGIRDDAASAGLDVAGTEILHPGPALAPPAPLGPDPSPADVKGFRARSEAAAAQNAKVDAYTVAAGEAGEVRTKEGEVGRSLGHLVSKKQQRLWFSAADIGFATVVVGGMELRGAHHKKQFQTRLAAAGNLQRLRSMVPESDYKDSLRIRSAEQLDRAHSHHTKQWDLHKKAPKVGKIGGGALAVGGFVYDVAVLDKPWQQAAVSGAASFGASVAAGALIGTAIPIPLVGTAIGATVGAGVGIFTSGMVDDLFESDHANISDAARAGIDALDDSGKFLWNALF